MSLFAERFKQLREKTGKTQAVIANDLGVKPQTISYYANGREPNYDMLARIADYFEVTTDYLIGLTNSPKRVPSAADELGLSQEAIDNLKKMKEWDSFAIHSIDYLLRSFEGKPVENDDGTFLTYMKYMDRSSAIGSLVAYLLPIQRLRGKCGDIVLLKDGEILIDKGNIDQNSIQGSYAVSEVFKVILEKNLTTQLAALGEKMWIDSLKFMQGKDEKGEANGNDPEAR